MFSSATTPGDAALASVLKHLVSGVFRVEVFVSGQDLHGGKLWPKGLNEALGEAKVILALVTPVSKESPWVHFETGAGFLAEKAIPVCGGGLTVSSLVPPFSLLQAREVTRDGLKKLLQDLAGLLGKSVTLDDQDIARIDDAIDAASQVPAHEDVPVAPLASEMPPQPFNLGDAEFADWYEAKVLAEPNWERALTLVEDGMAWRKRYEAIRGIQPEDLGLAEHEGLLWRIYRRGLAFDTDGPYCPHDGSTLRFWSQRFDLERDARNEDLVGGDSTSLLRCPTCRKAFALGFTFSRSVGDSRKALLIAAANAYGI